MNSNVLVALDVKPGAIIAGFQGHAQAHQDT
jgi:hypothetical protein